MFKEVHEKTYLASIKQGNVTYVWSMFCLLIQKASHWINCKPLRSILRHLPQPLHISAFNNKHILPHSKALNLLKTKQNYNYRSHWIIGEETNSTYLDKILFHLEKN